MSANQKQVYEGCEGNVESEPGKILEIHAKIRVSGSADFVHRSQLDSIRQEVHSHLHRVEQLIRNASERAVSDVGLLLLHTDFCVLFGRHSGGRFAGKVR